MRVLSTIETEPMVINGKLYKWYPRIRQEDIGSNTSNKFVDTCNIANPYCGLMNADFDKSLSHYYSNIVLNNFF